MEKLENINQYNKQQWIEKFTGSELHKKLINDFDELLWDKNNDCFNPHGSTTRQYWGTASPSFFSATIFYYLEQLLSNYTGTVHDIGCGWNIFKNYYHNIVGIGEEMPGSQYYFADHYGVVTDEFVFSHQNYFDCFFSINALHFRPLTEIRYMIEECISMLKPGASAFVTCNSTVLVSYDTPENIQAVFDTTYPDSQSIEDYIRQQLKHIDVCWHIVDIDLTEDNDGLDGNIRLLFVRPL
jgi:hypothetical protein